MKQENPQTGSLSPGGGRRDKVQLQGQDSAVPWGQPSEQHLSPHTSARVSGWRDKVIWERGRKVHVFPARFSPLREEGRRKP